jgi:hypothetical protein
MICVSLDHGQAFGYTKVDTFLTDFQSPAIDFFMNRQKF